MLELSKKSQSNTQKKLLSKILNKLFDNLREYPIPMNMLHQYMPISYAKIREGKLKLDPRELAMDGIVQFMLDYESAV